MSPDKITCPNCGTANKSSFTYCMACGTALPKAKPAETGPVQQQQPTKKKPKNSTVKLAIIVVASIVAGLLVYTGIYYLFIKHPVFDSVTTIAAAALNQTCPIMIDKETRLDKAVALPGKILEYQYTLVHAEKEKLDTDMIRQQLEPLMINTIKTNEQMKVLREHKTTLDYLYRDKNGDAIMLIRITPDMYE